jgi:class 3 adenylate cyclase
MKAKMQLMLSFTVILLSFLGSLAFISLSYHYFLQELQSQIIKDNQAIGEQLLHLFSEQGIVELSEERQADFLQHLCDRIKLPNGGFVCAVRDDGSLLASPGQQPGDKMTFAPNAVSDIKGEDRQLFLDLPADRSFGGLLSRDNTTDIIAAVPVEKTNIRLLVHQNLEELEARVKKFIRPLIAAGAGVSLFIGLITYLFANRIIKAYEHRLEKINQDLTVEKQKSDKLLLNILPVRVANDLKETGQTPPESFDEVSVFFSDIVDFTQTSAGLAPEVLIEELNDIFTVFDNIMEKNRCERVKTIGDAYLAVCGMSERNKNHADHMITSAKEILRYMEERNARSEIQWKIRIGIHSGKIVGGVVGVKKYIYDIFGDTINTASRMESTSAPMKINVSQATYQIVKDRFRFIARDPAEVKGKGQMMMYFLEN